MNGLEVLEKYPLAKNVVKDWFMRTMLESFKDENVHPIPSKGLLAGSIQHKGKTDWRLPTFDEATYLIDALSLNDLTASQKEFWTATPKKNGVYAFGLDKTYRLASSNDSCGILLIRSL